jgi:hypothetical protein
MSIYCRKEYTGDVGVERHPRSDSKMQPKRHELAHVVVGFFYTLLELAKVTVYRCCAKPWAVTKKQISHSLGLCRCAGS